MSAANFDRVTRTVLGEPVAFRRLAEPVGEFVYEGRINCGPLELWSEDGRWREDAAPHTNDLLITRARSAV